MKVTVGHERDAHECYRRVAMVAVPVSSVARPPTGTVRATGPSAATPGPTFQDPATRDPEGTPCTSTAIRPQCRREVRLVRAASVAAAGVVRFRRHDPPRRPVGSQITGQSSREALV